MKKKYLAAAVMCAGSLCLPFAATAAASQLKVAGPNILNNGKFDLPAKDNGVATVAAGGSEASRSTPPLRGCSCHQVPPR
jgi:hypothetical protein